MAGAGQVANPNDLIGRPYVAEARGPEAYDCWGVLLALTPESRAVALARPMVRAAMILSIEREGQWQGWKVTEQPLNGAVVVMGTPKKWKHVGVYWKGFVVHSLNPHGVVSERVWDLKRRWSRMEFYQWQG